MGFEDVAETDDAGLGFLAGVLDEAEAPFVVGQVSSGDVGSSCDSAWVAAFTANDTVRVSDLGDLINLGASATGKEPGDFVAIPNGPDAWLIEGDMESCAESVLAVQIDGTFVLASGSPAVVDMLFEICNEL